MQIRVDLGGWEHECCGESYDLNDVVTWELFLPVAGELADGADYMESHHGQLSGGVEVTGRVVAVEVASRPATFVSVSRLPSGRALRGFDEHDDGIPMVLATGDPLDGHPDEFVVTLEIAPKSELPAEAAVAI
jgi:hypothetical protein